MCPSLQQTIEQSLGLFFDGQNIGADFFTRAQRLRLVEVPGRSQIPNPPRAKSANLAKSDAVRRISCLLVNSNTPGKTAETFQDCLPNSLSQTAP
jgi:hypothetical protein